MGSIVMMWDDAYVVPIGTPVNTPLPEISGQRDSWSSPHSVITSLEYFSAFRPLVTWADRMLDESSPDSSPAITGRAIIISCAVLYFGIALVFFLAFSCCRETITSGKSS
ncbi:hypothetical protein GCK32_009653 [Trichostrongylus colubriformis]|uniref:Uncharacterized protein n=1 Tax=Trichostrongylus colubriformis TaxID=6319 RepID=A0AAN8FI01_TRICO